MADESNVIFGAEIDNGAFTAGANEIIETLQRVQKAESELKKTVAGLTTALALNAEEEKKVLAEIANLDKKSADYSKTVVTLQDRLSKLRAENISTTKGLLEAKKELADTSKVTELYKKNLAELSTTTTAYGKSVNHLGAEHNSALKALEKFTNANELVGEGMNHVRRQVVDAGLSFVTGLAGGILGFAIPSLEQLIEKLFESSEALSELEKTQAVATEIQTKANQEYAQGFAKLELYRAKLTDLSIPEKERVKILDEYNKIADKANQIDKSQLDNLYAINTAIDRQIELIRERALARASEAVIAQKAEKLFNEQERARVEAEEVDDIERKNGRILTITKKGGKAALKAVDEFEREGRIQRKVNADKAVKEAEEDFERALKLGIKFTTAAGLTSPDTKKDKVIENVFQQKLAELKARMAALQASEFQSDTLIENKFAAQLDKEFLAIGRLLKEKKLTIPQADFLKAMLRQINDIELSKSLEEFHKKQREAIEKIDDTILSNNLEAANKRIANIRDEFERDKEAIDQGYTATVDGLNKRLKDLLKGLQDQVDKGIITATQGRDKAFILTAIFGDLITQAGVDKTNKQLELAFRSFQNTIKEQQRVLTEDLLHVDETTTSKIVENTRAFFAGEITFKKYQENLTTIQKEGQRARQILRIQELKDELARIDKQIAATTDKTILAKLEDQQRQVRGQISSLTNEINTGAANDKNTGANKRIQQVVAYANSVQGLLQQIATFWSQVNSIEAASLDRSIALQQKRVDNAKDIANKGNAEYLEQEQKRLDNLERKREENARKQIAVNNALVLSNAAVAAIGAIAQAVTTGSPFAAIAAVAAVIGAIAAGFAFVNSLQPQSANFYEGTEYVQGTGRPRGKDTVPANLTIGERVTTAQKNQEYWDTLQAVHHGLVPANVLNEFVNNYPNVPMVDYGKLSEATNNKMGHDSHEVANQLKETNAKLDEVIQAVSSIRFENNLDADGFSSSLTTHIKREKLRQRS